jgi:hypothetical protein
MYGPDLMKPVLTWTAGSRIHGARSIARTGTRLSNPGRYAENQWPTAHRRTRHPPRCRAHGGVRVPAAAPWPALAKIRHTHSNFELNATIHSEQLHDNRERKLTSNLEAPCSAHGERRMPSSSEQFRHHKRPILGEAATTAFSRARGRPQAPSTVRTTIESEIPPRRHRATSPTLSLWFSTRVGFLEVGMARTGPRDADMGTSAAEGSGRWALAGQSRSNRSGRCARGARCAVERGGEPTSHRSRGAQACG